MQNLKHFDFFVIGGGSAGLAAAKEANKYNIKVGLADFVRPTPIGTKWGIGGTCVNVGCIPKKLFHQAGFLGHEFTFLQRAGYEIGVQKPKHTWSTLVQNVTDNIRSSNWKSKVAMRDKNIEYFNKFAFLKSANEIELTAQNGQKEVVTAKYILIATGGRPTYPQIPGAKQHSITSDDIFWRHQNPGKTLVVGASYIALETAGFMQQLGIDVTVMVRSIFLRGFDQQLSNKVADYMKKIGVKFIRDSVPLSINKIQGDGDWKSVKYQTTQDGNTVQSEDKFQTVLFAIGRSAETKNMGLEKIGVKIAKNGKIIVNENDKTDVDGVFALGDVVEGRLQLTPPAILSGKLLVHRLFGNSSQKVDYRYLPTTIFTPLEYGACGYSEEDAIKEFGQQNIVAYGSKYHPFEWDLSDFATNDCYAKIVVQKNNKQIANRVIGIHYLGPHAGEVVQGFAIAVKKGISKQDLDLSVGIHPTSAQEFTLLSAIAGSPNEEKQGCCS